MTARLLISKWNSNHYSDQLC